MNKWSRIKFMLLFEIFKDENVLKEFMNRELIQMSVNSSQSIFKTRVFQPINFDLVHKNSFFYSFKIPIIIFQNLEWPHETNCRKNEIKLKS
jgi:hypothetical protein